MSKTTAFYFISLTSTVNYDAKPPAMFFEGREVIYQA